MIAGDHHAAVMGEACENGERRVAVEKVVGIEVRHIGVALAVGGNADVGIDTEGFADRNGGIGQF